MRIYELRFTTAHVRSRRVTSLLHQRYSSAKAKNKPIQRIRKKRNILQWVLENGCAEIKNPRRRDAIAKRLTALYRKNPTRLTLRVGGAGWAGAEETRPRSNF